jgi:hypothetical protein
VIHEIWVGGRLGSFANVSRNADYVNIDRNKKTYERIHGICTLDLGTYLIIYPCPAPYHDQLST